MPVCQLNWFLFSSLQKNRVFQLTGTQELPKTKLHLAFNGIIDMALLFRKLKLDNRTRLRRQIEQALAIQHRVLVPAHHARSENSLNSQLSAQCHRTASKPISTNLDTSRSQSRPLLLHPPNKLAKLGPFLLRADTEETQVWEHVRQAVIDQCTGKTPAVDSFEKVYGFRSFRAPIADDVGLVEDDTEPLDAE